MYGMVLVFGLCALALLAGTDALAQSTASLLNEARAAFMVGNYQEAIGIYDVLLESSPGHPQALKMKGIALSNLGEHRHSLEQFYVAYQADRSDVTALVGLGAGLGNLGEYQESRRYFGLALDEAPDDTTILNYLAFVDSVIEKYPYTPTERPEDPRAKQAKIPQWVRQAAAWWSGGHIGDAEFAGMVGYLVSAGAIDIPGIIPGAPSGGGIPEEAREDIGLWSQGDAGNDVFAGVVIRLVEDGVIQASVPVMPAEIEDTRSAELGEFKRYLGKISSNIAKEKRYIEYPNPSGDVIKKFLRDYVKWNFDQEVQTFPERFPDPTYYMVDDMIVIKYLIYVNEQPSGLPLDHAGTLDDSLRFWLDRELVVRGQDARVVFEYTTQKHEANVWVTWVVRDLGKGVLGHAHVGKGVVEVALGDYGCDGSFQLYDVDTVMRVMTHELGHSIGLRHVSGEDNKDDIMYPYLNPGPGYAYCLLR